MKTEKELAKLRAASLKYCDFWEQMVRKLEKGHVPTQKDNVKMWKALLVNAEHMAHEPMLSPAGK